MDYSEMRSQVVSVYGDPHAKKLNRVPAYTRMLSTKEITFTCTVCNKIVTQERYPSHKPLYCSDDCQTQGTKEKKRKREQERRAKARKQKQTEQQQ